MIRCSFTTCALLLSLALATAVFAQDEGRGERGGEGGWGGRRGGDRGGGGDFLRRMDANGNGMIDPEEAEGRAGGFLRRIAENNPEIDLSKPVPLEKLEQSMAAARERWGMGGGGGGPGGPPRSEDGGERRDGGNSGSSSSSSSASKTPERLVPGFGEEIAAAEVPGFGLMTKALAVVKITDADRQEAQRRMGWFDRNNDGVLEGDEFEQAKSRGYNEFDSNKDNKLTIDELAMRYAKRRAEEEAAAKAAAVSSSSSSSSNRRDEGSRSSKPSTSSTARVTKSSATKPYRIASADERLAKKGLPSWFLDKDDNGDGQVAMAEYGESWTDSSLAEFAKFDLNSDGVITPAECLRAGKLSGSSLASARSGYGSRSSSGYGNSSRPSSSSGSRTEVAKVEPPKTPPQSSSSTSRDSDDKEEEDADDEASDEESSPASAQSNSGGGESSTGGATESGSSGVTSAKIQTSSTPATPAPATENVAIDPRYMSYAQGRIKQVDANGDGILQPDEWIKMTKAPLGADANGDKQITPDELALFFQKGNI